MTMWRDIIFEPSFPAQQVIGSGVVVGVLAVVAYVLARRDLGRRRRIVLAALRLTVLAAVVTLLLRPMVFQPLPEPVTARPPVFAVVVDVSASMNTRDDGTVSRLETVQRALQAAEANLTRELGAAYDVRVGEFADTFEPASWDSLKQRTAGHGDKTDLAAALLGAANATGPRPPAGVLLISDGRENAGGDVSAAARFLKSQKVPVWTALVGSAGAVKDLFVTMRLNQNFLFAKQPASLRAELSQTGYDGWYAKAHLYREDEYVTSRQVILRESTTRVEFPIHEDHRGVFKYSVVVDPLPGEADVKNNDRVAFARVVDEKPKVLLVEAEPYWDTKFLLRVLQADPNLEVTSIFQLSPKKVFAVREQTSADTLEKAVTRAEIRMPRTREELFHYDCVILGRNLDALLSVEQYRLLKAFLTERGGSIVFARGRAVAGDAPELAGLEPLTWEESVWRDVRFELTTEGRLSPVFALGATKPTDLIIRELPAMVSVTRVQKEKSLAVILATAPGEREARRLAVIAYQRVGKGKVMSIGSAGLWRWSLLADDLIEYEDVYRRYWAQMIRWLVDESDFLPGQDISFRTDKYAYSVGEPVRLVIHTKNVAGDDYRPRVRLTTPDGIAVALEPAGEPDTPALYQAVYLPETEGEFRATLTNNVGQPAEDVARFTVYSDSVETRFVAADADTMTQIARTTGGTPIALSALAELPRQVRQFELATREKMKKRDAWDKLPVFALVMGVLAAEWWLRRRSGLV